MHRSLGDFDVDPRRVVQSKPQAGAAVDDVRAERLAKPRDQRVQPAVARRWQVVRPQRFGQLVAPHEPVPVSHEVGEQQLSLAARQPGIDALAGQLNHGRSAELDPGR